MFIAVCAVGYFMILGIVAIVGLGSAPKAEQKRRAYINGEGAAKIDAIFEPGTPQVTWTEMIGAKIRIADVVARAGNHGYALTMSTPTDKKGTFTNHVFTRG